MNKGREMINATAPKKVILLKNHKTNILFRLIILFINIRTYEPASLVILNLTNSIISNVQQ